MKGTSNIMRVACRRSQTNPRWSSLGRIGLDCLLLFWDVSREHHQNHAENIVVCCIGNQERGATQWASSERIAGGWCPPESLSKVEQPGSVFRVAEGGPVGKLRQETTVGLSSLGAIYSRSRLVLLETMQAWEYCGSNNSALFTERNNKFPQSP